MGLLRVLLAATLVVPLILFLIIAWRNYDASVASAVVDLERLSAIGQENADKIFESQDQLCYQVGDLIGGMSDADIRADELALHNSLARIVARLPHVASVLVASKDGTPLVSTGLYPVPRAADPDNLDYKAIIGGHEGSFVNNLRIDKILRQPLFGLGRPWTGPNGDRRGVIDVAVSPLFFASFYQVLLGEGAGGTDGKVITLIRDDGQILVHYPPFAKTPPPVAEGRFLEAIKVHPSDGIYGYRGSVDNDGRSRLYAYRKLRGYPLYVIAGRSWNAILSGWRSTTIEHLLFGVPAAVALFALARMALARSGREQAALLRANQEIKRREIAEDVLLRAQRLEAVGQLTGGVAHDFNNLLTVILGNAAMIDRHAEDVSSVRRLAAGIQLASKRGANITQQLLAFAGRQIVRPEIIDLNHRLREFGPLLKRAASASVRLAFDLAVDLHPVSVDPGQFEAAILNLVGNARDAMPEGGRAVIATRNATADAANVASPSGTCVHISVTDTGVGMDRDTLAKAFEPFFTTKGVGKGTGLGLSQVYGFARQAGGKVWISSTAGTGTHVEIVLPASIKILSGAQCPALPPELDAATAGDASAGSVVLVVEDEPTVLELAVETLRELGYETLAAADASTALRRLRQANRVDLLFTDIVMPGGMNGVQLSNEARRLRPDIKVVLTSGYTGNQCGDLPDDVALLIKPYNRAELGKQLAASLLRRQAAGNGDPSASPRA